MFLSEFYDKDVLSVKKALYLGKVKGVYINKTNKKPLALMVENGQTQYVLKFRRVAGNKEKVTVYNKNYLEEFNPNDFENYFLLDKTVKAYTDSGYDLGYFVDINLTGEKLIWFDKPYPFKFIEAMENKTVTINMELKKPKPEKKIVKKQTSPYIPDEKVVNDYNFLIGRIVIRDIIDKEKDVYIRKGTVINKSVIDVAKKSGKLVYLALSSLLD